MVNVVIRVKDSWNASMKFAMLCSGSKGNCFVIQEDDCTIVIDCGSTKKYLTTCFKQLSIDSIDALLLTHQHSDHCSQLSLFTCPVYCSDAIKNRESEDLVVFKPFTIKGLKITAIPLSHDYPSTVGFVIEGKKEKCVYITDTGYINTSMLNLLIGADYIVLESNHDTELLMNTSRPDYLKARIYSDYGHLANEDCAATLECIITENTKEVFLAHLSSEANTPEQALMVNCDVIATITNKRDGLIVVACQQFEIIQGGNWDEKNYMATHYHTFSVE